MSITSPQVIDGRYRLEGEIGHGGMAVVYRAYDERLNRQVAIKMMRPQFVNDQTFLARFRREAQALANLSHPNLAAVWDTGEAAGVPYIVMEYVDGDNLKTRIVAEAPFSAERSIRLMIQICEGVGAAHRAGVVHRDLKPQNILISRLGQIKVADFGIARSLATAAAAATHTSQVWGTAQYIAPEQAAGQPVSPATDVYSLGIILFEMLTGRLPFEGETPLALAMQHVQQPAPAPRTLNPKIPPGLDAIVLRAVMKQPDDRYRDADALCATLKAYQRLGEQTTGPIPVVPRAARAAGDLSPPVTPRPTGRVVTYTPPAASGPASTLPAERDWGTLALGVTAALAVLGLIPLYWMVIQRFSGG